MQISRMPIPADDCATTEMSVESNASNTKSSTETMAKVNGDCHKSVNGSAVDDTKEADEASEGVVEEETIKDKEPAIKTESLSECTDKLVENGESECELQAPEKIAEETNEEKVSAIVDDNEHKIKLEINEVDNEETEPMEIDESENQPDESQDENLVIVKEELEELEESKSKVSEKEASPEKETLLRNGEVIDQDVEVTKNNIIETNPLNGELRPIDEEKIIKIEKVIHKVSVEEDMSSEVSTDTLSPKQVEEPIARKRSAASHDELSVVSGASSDTDLPKTKKLRSEEEAPVVKDDTRERLIKNIVQSCGKNEVELTKNIDKIQNEIKVITEIAQTKRDELVTLIRLQKLKEEIIERLITKMKELDAAKTDNSKDWNLPEMFQINLSQPEHILNEKNISDIVDNREMQLEKSAIIGYDQNSYTTTSPNMSVTSVSLASNSQPNDWILADRANRAGRAQRVILPKPTFANNAKEGRQGPILDVKLIIADHRSKNPETAVPKRGRRKAPINEFSVPTSSVPLRYPNPMGFGNPMHHVNDGNFKTTLTNSHGVPSNVMEHVSEHNRFKDVPAFPEVTLHPVAQTMQSQQQLQHQQQQQTSLLHGILTKGSGTHHLPMSMPNTPTNYSPTLARLLTAPERCKQSRGKQRQTIPAATVVSSNTQSRNEITITPVQSTSMSSTFQQKSTVTPNIPPAQVDDEDASDRLIIDEGQDVVNANSPTSAPQCQGCMQKPAQFVCAGCGNQWYCSKDCQIDAWDEHSEICSG